MRCSLSLLLVLVQLLAPGLCFGHAHDVTSLGEPGGHHDHGPPASRYCPPHIHAHHLPFWPAHRHDEHDDHHDCDGADPQVPPDEHDDGALYGSAALIFRGHSLHQGERSLSFCWTLPHSGCPADVRLVTQLPLLLGLPPPDLGPPLRCGPVYLTTLRIRI